MVLPIPEVFAVTPATVNSSSQANAIDYPNSRLLQYCNGYYFLFQVQSVTNFYYQSSQTGASGTWSGLSAAITTTLPSVREESVYCDGSGNVYAMWGTGAGATQFQYRQGTASAGVITWSFAAVTITPSHCGTICAEFPSIYAFSTSDVIIAMRNVDGGSVTYTEVMSCQTAPCSTAGNWATNLADSTHPCNGGCTILGLSSSANWAMVEPSPTDTVYVRTTSNSGTSWTAAVATSHTYQPDTYGCVAHSSTVYCAWYEDTRKTVYFLTFVQGAGSWTETSIVTFGSSTGGGATLAGDGTNFEAFYTPTTTTTIDFQTSTNGGSTWSGDAAWLSGEATGVGDLVATPTIQTSAGVAWALATSNTLRFAASAALTGTVNLTCILKESGATTETWTASGASVSPTSGSCTTGAGTTTALTVSLSSTVTITVQADGANTRYRFNASATSSTTQSISTPSGGSSSVTIWNYYQLQNTYTMTPSSPSTWDASYTQHPIGTATGVGSSNICTISLVSASGAANCSGWSDYNLAVSLPASFASSVAGTWTSTGTHSWTDTTGGNSHNTNYNLLDSVTQKVTIPVDNSGPSGTATITGCDTTAATIAMDGVQHTFSADQSCLLTFTVPSDGANTRYRFGGGSGSLTFTHTTASSGTESYGSTAYYELQNTYTMSPSVPATWDHAYSEPVTGTVVGTGATTICTVSLSNGGGSASCTGWGDYNRAASTVSTFSSFVAGTWTAIGTNSFSDTTGGNTHTVLYDIIFATGFTLTLTKDQAGSPTLTFSMSGCAVSPSTILGDGSPHTFSSAAGCTVTVFRPGSPTDRVVFDSTGTNAISLLIVAGNTYGPYTFNYQVDVTVTTEAPTLTSTVPSGSAWYNYGTVLPAVTVIFAGGSGLPVAAFDHWVTTNSSIILGNPTNLSTPATLGGGGTIEALVTVLTYQVLPPNPLTVTFWWFPTVVTILITMIYLLTATRAGATTWARNYMVLTGLVEGILMAIVSETMPFPMLILALIMWILYAFRG